MKSKHNVSTKVELHCQADYDLWIASNPNFAEITYFVARNLPLVTELPGLPNVTAFWAEDMPLVTTLPDLPNVTDFWADDRITKLRQKP